MSLDLGTLVGRVSLEAVEFDRTYVRVVRQMQSLGAQAARSTAGTSSLDKGLTGVASAGAAAATGLGRADMAMAGAGVSASALRDATVASGRAMTEADIAASRLTQAELRQAAATDRLIRLQLAGRASTGQLAAAQASLIASNDRVSLSQSRVRTSSNFSSRTLHGLVGEATGLTSAMESIPTPVTVVAGALGKLAIGAAVTAAAIAAVSIHAAEQFQTGMTRLRTQANVSTADVARLSRGVLNMAGDVATTPKVLADAAYHIASVGQNSLTTGQQLAILRISAQGAKLGGADLVDVTNALDAAIVSGIHGVKNYSQAMGVLNSTVGAGDMQMQDLADAFGPLGAVLKGYNVTIQQAGAALATFGDNNIRGAIAGTQLRMAVQAMVAPTRNGAAQLEAWGLASGNLTAQLQRGGLTEALDTLMRKLRANGITAKAQGDVLTQAFGKRAGVGLNILIGELNRYHNKLNEVTRGGDRFAGSWAAYRKTFEYNAGAARAALSKVEIELGNRLLPTATHVLHWLATTGVHDLDRFGHWFDRNKGTMAHFAAVWVGGMDAIATSALDGFGIAIDAAAKAGDSLSVFGGVLGNVFGGKAKKAAADFDAFRATTLGTMNSLLDGLLSVANEGVGPAEAIGENIGGALAGGIARGAALKAGLTLSVANQIAGKVGADYAHKHGAKSVNINIPQVNVAPIPLPSPVTTAAGSTGGSGGGSGGGSTKTKPAGPTVADLAGTARIRHAAQLVVAALGDGFTGSLADLEKRLRTLAGGSVKGIVAIVTDAAADVKQSLDAADQQLKADRQARAQAAAGYAQTALGGLDLSNAVVNHRVGNLSAFLGRGIHPLQLEHDDLAKLRKRGLNPHLLAQIAGEAPQDAIALAQSILSGQSGSIAHLNALDRHARSLAKATGMSVAGAQYDARIARDEAHRRDVRHTLHEIRGSLHDLVTLAKKNPHDVAGALNTALAGAHHRSTAQVGR